MAEFNVKKSTNRTFNNRYAENFIRFYQFLGSFGIVFVCEDFIQNNLVALKVEKNKSDNILSLNRETEILAIIKGIKGVPKLLWYGFEHGYNCIAMQLLGHDMSYSMKIYKTLSLKCVCNIADQMITILQYIHQRGFQKQIISKKILTIKLRKSQLGKNFIGTIRYASLAAHHGFELGRKDDLESLGYDNYHGKIFKIIMRKRNQSQLRSKNKIYKYLNFVTSQGIAKDKKFDWLEQNSTTAKESIDTLKKRRSNSRNQSNSKVPSPQIKNDRRSSQFKNSIQDQGSSSIFNSQGDFLKIPRHRRSELIKQSGDIYKQKQQYGFGLELKNDDERFRLNLPITNIYPTQQGDFQDLELRIQNNSIDFQSKIKKQSQKIINLGLKKKNKTFNSDESISSLIILNDIELGLELKLKKLQIFTKQFKANLT